MAKSESDMESFSESGRIQVNDNKEQIKNYYAFARQETRVLEYHEVVIEAERAGCSRGEGGRGGGLGRARGPAAHSDQRCQASLRVT
jgi:hypothetical protein